VSVQLQVAHEQLATGLRAERRTAALISILYLALARAFHLVGELVQTGEQARLAAARNAHRRTQQHIERAEAERERAVRLVSVIGRKIMTLQSELLRSHDDLLDDIDAGLDRIERLLDAQNEELAQLDTEVAAWTLRRSASDVDVARLHEILADESISFSHRIDAAWKISSLGEEHWGDADQHLRLIIMTRVIDHPLKLSAIDSLARFGPRRRAEAVAILQQIISEEGNDALDRMHATDRLRSFAEAEKTFSVAFLRRLAEGQIGGVDDHGNRIDAIPRWLALAPEDRDVIVALARELAEHEETMDYEKKKMAEFINNVLTDPWT
jgi:hypothetical protein